jgi:hypothetical protein
MSNQERAPDIDKKRPAGGTAGQSNRGDLSGSRLTANSPDRQGLLARWRWIDQIASDKNLPPNATRVAVAIASHINGDTGAAWPSIDRLADILGLVANSVRKSIRAMVRGGHLAVEIGGGSASNRYRLIAKADHTELSKRRPADPCTQMHPSEAAPLHASAGDPCISVEGTPAFPCTPPLHANAPELSYKNSPNEHAEATRSLERVAEVIPIGRGEGRFKRTRRGGQQLSIPVEVVDSTAEPRDFAAFFHIYPKKVGRLEAVEAFREAIKHADAGEIIAGAQRYAEARRAAEPDPVQRERFTASADKWLRGRRWRDEHAAPRPPGVGKHFAAALADLEADLA